MKGKKTGGRTKGTPNKQTQINQALGRNLQKDGIIPLLQHLMFGGDLPPQLEDSPLARMIANVEDKDALAFVEKLMQYVIPKQQSQTIDLSGSVGTHTTIEDRLAELSEENG